MRSTRHEAGEVRDVEHHVRPDFVGDLLERLGLDASRIARGARHDHARAVLVREATNFIKVDALIVDAHFVRTEVVEDAACVHR